jgi:hypothetical protein
LLRLPPPHLQRCWLHTSTPLCNFSCHGSPCLGALLPKHACLP